MVFFQMLEEHHRIQPFYLRTYPSDITWNNQFIQILLLGPEIITCLCVLFSSDKFLTSINSCKAFYQPNSFAHSLTNLLYWVYWAHPLLLSGFGLRFVTLQKQWPNSGMMYSIPKLYIQNNLPNTTKYENKLFFLYSNLGFEFRIKEIKIGYTTFWNQVGPWFLR